jgi:hypothetical protein
MRKFRFEIEGDIWGNDHKNVEDELMGLLSRIVSPAYLKVDIYELKNNVVDKSAQHIISEIQSRLSILRDGFISVRLIPITDEE